MARQWIQHCSHRKTKPNRKILTLLRSSWGTRLWTRLATTIIGLIPPNNRVTKKTHNLHWQIAYIRSAAKTKSVWMGELINLITHIFTRTWETHPCDEVHNLLHSKYRCTTRLIQWVEHQRSWRVDYDAISPLMKQIYTYSPFRIDERNAPWIGCSNDKISLWVRGEHPGDFRNVLGKI